MRHINFDLDLKFSDPNSKWFSEKLLIWGLSILTIRNIHFLRENPTFPKLYDTDMVYLLPEQLERRPSEASIKDLGRFLSDRMQMTQKEIAHHTDLARGVEIFRDIPRMMENGGGDCDNWSAAIAAERVIAGCDVRPYMTCREYGNKTIYHALDLWKDGSSEDPSLIKGMGGPERRLERREECRKNVERYDNYWQDAKRLLADEDHPTHESRLARAVYLKSKIDAIGLLPKDGIFRVGRPGVPLPKPRIVGSFNPRALLGLDVFTGRAA